MFKPHSQKKRIDKETKEETETIKSRSFFKELKYDSEEERRKFSQKWETTLHATDRMRGSSLHKPYFEVHYISRDAAGSPKRKERIKYTLVVTVEAKKHPQIFNDILKVHVDSLVELTPRIEIETSV